MGGGLREAVKTALQDKLPENVHLPLTSGFLARGEDESRGSGRGLRRQ